MLNRVDLYTALCNKCTEAGGQSAFAKKHGVSVAYVSDVLNGRKSPGPALLKAMGLRKVVRYEPVKGAE